MLKNRKRDCVSEKPKIGWWKEPCLIFILLSMLLILALTFFVFSSLPNYVDIELSSLSLNDHIRFQKILYVASLIMVIAITGKIVSIVAEGVTIAILLLLTRCYRCF